MGISVKRSGGGDEAVHSVTPSLRSTPATCLSSHAWTTRPPGQPSPSLWFAQGTQCGTVNIFHFRATEGTGGEGRSEPEVRASLHFDRQIDPLPVTDLAWNATRSQLAVVRSRKVTFFYICVDEDDLECTELQTFDYAKPIRTIEWMLVDPVIVFIDVEGALVAYDTPRRTFIELGEGENGGGQASVAAGRFLDEIASFGSGSARHLCVWNAADASCHQSISHPAPLQSITWCCTQNHGILVSATAGALHLWRRSTLRSTTWYVGLREIRIDYGVTTMKCVFPYRDSALILCHTNESGQDKDKVADKDGMSGGEGITVHRHAVLMSANHLPLISTIEPLRLESSRALFESEVANASASSRGEEGSWGQFALSAFTFDGNGGHCVTAATRGACTLWQLDSASGSGGGGARSMRKVSASASFPTNRGNQTPLVLTKFLPGCLGMESRHDNTILALCVDSESVAYLWMWNVSESSSNFKLGHSLGLPSQVLDAAWVTGCAGQSRDALFLLKDKRILVVRVSQSSDGLVEEGRWAARCDWDRPSGDLAIVNAIRASETALTCQFQPRQDCGSLLCAEVNLGNVGGDGKSHEAMVSNLSPALTGNSQSKHCGVRVLSSGEQKSCVVSWSPNSASLVRVSMSSGEDSRMEKYQIEGWTSDWDVLSSTLSRDCRYLFVLVKLIGEEERDRSELLVWERRRGRVFELQTTVIAAGGVMAYDVIPLPWLTPAVATCAEGKVWVWHYDPLECKFAPVLVSESAPSGVASLRFASADTVLLATGREVLAMRIQVRPLGKKTSNLNSHSDSKWGGLGSLQRRLCSLYNPFGMMDSRCVKECVLGGNFQALGVHLDLFEDLATGRASSGQDRAGRGEGPGGRVHGKKMVAFFLSFFTSHQSSPSHASRGIGKVTRRLLEGDLGSLAQSASFLSGRDTGTSDCSASAWAGALEIAERVHGQFLNTPKTTSEDERVILSYLYKSSLQELQQTRERAQQGKAPGSSVGGEKISTENLDETDLDGAWGVFNRDTEVVLQTLTALANAKKLTWQEISCSGLGFWMASRARLTPLFEKIAKSEFLRKRDPHDCALFYLALNKINVLSGLCRATQNTKLGGFLKRDFNQEANRVAALKNAYALLGQHRYELAAAFFLLARKSEDAVEVCVKNLEDVQLGLCVALLQSLEGGKDYRKALIEGVLMPRAVEDSHYHMCLLYTVMLKDASAAMDALHSVFCDKTKWLCLVRALSPSEIFHFIHLAGEIYYRVAENRSEGAKVSAEAEENREMNFIANYSEKVSCLGQVGLTVRWCQRLAARMRSGDPSQRYLIFCRRILSDLVCGLQASCAVALRLLPSSNSGEVERAFCEVGRAAWAALDISDDFSEPKQPRAALGELDLALGFFESSGPSLKSEVEVEADRGSPSPARGQEQRTGGTPEGSAMAAPVLIHRFPKAVRALAVNPCNTSEAAVSTGAGLATARLRLPGKSSCTGNFPAAAAEEVFFKSKYPQDSWTVPVLSGGMAGAGRTYMPQWAILNVAKAEVSAANRLSAHPHRPLFASDGVSDAILLWHFHQQSAMSCYRLQGEKLINQKSKVRSLCFDSRGDRLAAAYSTGECALFSVNALPLNGTSIDGDIWGAVFEGGSACDVAFLGQSSSVLLAAGPGGFCVWDALSPKLCSKISLRNLGRVTRICIPHREGGGNFHTFLCGDDRGGVALFDMRRLAPATLPLWSEGGSQKQSGNFQSPSSSSQHLGQGPDGSGGGGNQGVTQFAACGKLVFSLHEDRKCKVWDLSKQRQREIYVDCNQVTHINSVDGGLVLCTKDNQMSFLSLPI